MKRIRITALIAGLAADLIGTILFSIPLTVVFLALRHGNGDSPQAALLKLSRDTGFLIIGYFGGIAFTFLGAYITGRMSRPDSVLNSLMLASSLRCSSFPSHRCIRSGITCFLRSRSFQFPSCPATCWQVKRSNQSMKPPAPLRSNFNVFGTSPCRGLSLSRWMKSRVVVFTLLIAGSAFAAEGWWSPDKAYSIVPPVDWSQSTLKGEQNSSYAFTSPDHKAEIRVSAAYHISLPENMPDDVLEMAFPKERGITPIARIYGTAWDGLRREYTDADESARWLGFAARHGSTVVLLTMKAPAKEFERFRPIFEAVGQSITFAQ